MSVVAAKYTPIRSDKDSKKRLRHIETPEGVKLAVYLASRGDRVSAVLLDFVIIFVTIVVVVLLAIFILGYLFGLAVGGIFYLLAYFFLRSFYFIFFEMKWQGQTPGKKYFGLRVIKRSGGRLDTGAIFARNMMREVEVFLPFQMIISSGQLGYSGWTILCIWLWCGVMVLMPFFNKDNLRAGDLVGGTWVISIPKSALLDEVGQHAQESNKEGVASGPEIHFTGKQLSVYGIYELHTLENVLRSEKWELHNTVAGKIQSKIGWQSDLTNVNSYKFLQAFYSALRRHHESEILMGRRKENKFSGEGKKTTNTTLTATSNEEEKPKVIKNILKDR